MHMRTFCEFDEFDHPSDYSLLKASFTPLLRDFTLRILPFINTVSSLISFLLGYLWF